MLSPRRSVGSSIFGGVAAYTSTTPPLSQHPPSPSNGAATPPSNPIPESGSRPHDVLANRLHEVKRITKSLVAYFEGVSTAHTQHAATLLKLSSPSIIQSPLPESSLFLPTPASPHGQMGWADLLSQLRDSNKQVADEHSELAKTVSKSVVLPLKKLRVEIKSHLGLMEKELGKLAQEVLKEREHSVVFVAALDKALQPPTTTTLVLPTPQDDPFLHRVTAEIQLRQQTVKENELLKLVLVWQDKSELLEHAVWDKVAQAWRVWEESNSNMLLGNQQRSVILSANVDSLPLDAEWSHFTKLNHLLPRDTAPILFESVDYPHKDDVLTGTILEGHLERQKRFVKTWKQAFFVLTPSGNLHEFYAQDGPLNKPAVSLHLPLCTLGPMPSAEPSKNGRPAEATFTVEGPDSRNVFRAKSWDELNMWWQAIERYTKVAPVPLASPPMIPVGTGEHGDIGGKEVPAIPTDEQDAEDDDRVWGQDDENELNPEARGLPPTPPPPLPPRAAPVPSPALPAPPTSSSTPSSPPLSIPSTPPSTHRDIEASSGDLGVPSSPPPPPPPSASLPTPAPAPTPTPIAAASIPTPLSPPSIALPDSPAIPQSSIAIPSSPAQPILTEATEAPDSPGFGATVVPAKVEVETEGVEAAVEEMSLE
ncbi:hypothetical protein RQP46_011064 [Phenoliferia psychrophenolica]